eukprot:611297-Rhodomonas_salina.4
MFVYEMTSYFLRSHQVQVFGGFLYTRGSLILISISYNQHGMPTVKRKRNSCGCLQVGFRSRKLAVLPSGSRTLLLISTWQRHGVEWCQWVHRCGMNKQFDLSSQQAKEAMSVRRECLRLGAHEIRRQCKECWALQSEHHCD